MAPRLAESAGLAALVEQQAVNWGLGLATAAAAVALTLWLWRRGARLAVLVLQAALLTQLFPVVMTDVTAPYRGRPAWRELLPGPAAAVVRQDQARPGWGAAPPLTAPDGPRTPLKRASAELLDPVPGVIQGLSFPLAANVEGLNSRRHTTVLVALAGMDWRQRIGWLRRLGVDAVVSTERLSESDLERKASLHRLGVDHHLYAVASPAPPAWWPERVETLDDPLDVLRRATALAPGVAYVGERLPPQTAGGEVAVVEESPDSIRLAVSGPGGLVVVRRAFTPLWRATTDGGVPLDVVAVDHLLTGVVAPPGEQRVRLFVSSRPETIAALLALVGFVSIGIVGWRTTP